MKSYEEFSQEIEELKESPKLLALLPMLGKVGGDITKGVTDAAGKVIKGVGRVAKDSVIGKDDKREVVQGKKLSGPPKG